MSMSRALMPAFVGLALLLAQAPARAGAVNEIDGLAIKGYDPVAYFTDGKAVAGQASLTAMHEGATYRFASAEHRDAFLAAPAKYLPQYGGFCAFGTAEGYKAGIDPEMFTIVGDRLYLNFNRDIQSKWSTDIPGYVGKAERNWPSVSQTEKVYR